MREPLLPGGGYAVHKLHALGISQANARAFATRMRIHSYDANACIWRKGEDLTHWSAIISGLVVASLGNSERGEVSVALYGSDAWFGEHSILSEKPSFADYRCLVPVDVLQIESRHVFELLDLEPRFAVKLAKMASWRVQKTSEILMLMRMGNPVLRAVVGLCQFAENMAYNADRPPTIGYGDEITIPVNQTVLASLCGVSRSKLSAIIQQLAKAGWVRLEYGRIEILNLGAWHAFSRLQRRRGVPPDNLTIEDLIRELEAADLAHPPLH